MLQLIDNLSAKLFVCLQLDEDSPPDRREPHPMYWNQLALLAMQDMSVRQLVAVTGLSDHYLWQVREGEERLHAPFWERIASA